MLFAFWCRNHFDNFENSKVHIEWSNKSFHRDCTLKNWQVPLMDSFEVPNSKLSVGNSSRMMAGCPALISSQMYNNECRHSHRRRGSQRRPTRKASLTCFNEWALVIILTQYVYTEQAVLQQQQCVFDAEQEKQSCCCRINLRYIVSSRLLRTSTSYIYK